MKTAVLSTPASEPTTHLRHRWIFSPSARPLRFVVAGIAAAGMQITILGVLVAAHEGPEWSNALAVLGGMQVSFVLSSLFTWHDQPASGWGALTRRWLRYTATLSVTALLNEGAFLIVYHWLPVIVASLLASSVIGILNYTLGQRFIFSH